MFQPIVAGFYRRMLADPLLAPFFTHVDIAASREHRAASLLQAPKRPNQHHGRHSETAHAGLQIRKKHFFAMAAHRVNLLFAMGLDEDTIGDVAPRLESLSRQIVNHPPKIMWHANDGARPRLRGPWSRSPAGRYSILI